MVYSINIDVLLNTRFPESDVILCCQQRGGAVTADVNVVLHASRIAGHDPRDCLAARAWETSLDARLEPIIGSIQFQSSPKSKIVSRAHHLPEFYIGRRALL